VLHVTYFVVGFSTFAVLIGCVILVNPAAVYDLLRRYKGSVGLYAVAIIVRIVLGIALLVVAPLSKFPLVLQAVGWLAIVAAVVFLAMGRPRFNKIIEWALDLSLHLGRLSGLFALLFGVFLVYAVL
jgi:hypothetical protein